MHLKKSQYLFFKCGKEKMNFLEIVQDIRCDKNLDIDERNKNRYQITVNEKDQSKTAYCFSIPIYEKNSKNLINSKFSTDGNTVYLKGTNSIIELSSKAIFKSNDSVCEVSLPDKATLLSEDEALCGSSKIIPTTNGIAVICPCRFGESIHVKLIAPTPFMPIRTNVKYFSLMCAKFKPLITLSCLGATNDGMSITYPCELSFRQISEIEFSIFLKQMDENASYIMYEINMHEEKLIQDTTVESLHPTENNSFGSTGFIGQTNLFGEQWLYTRPETPLLHELNGMHINKAVMYIPSLNGNKISLSAYEISRRFCSFGSNWINKIDEINKVSSSNESKKYHSIDITNLLSDKASGALFRTVGFLIKPTHKSDSFAAIATADSYLFPQILEINYM